MSSVEHVVCEWLKSFSSAEAHACKSMADLSDGTILRIVASEMYALTYKCFNDFRVVFDLTHPFPEHQTSITG